MFNAGLFGSNFDYGEECENIDKKRCRVTSRQSEQNASWARYMEMRSTSEFINGDQTTLQELMSLKRMPHTTLDGNHHNRQL